MALAGRRILIDASMVRGGGGFTHAVNIVPLLATIEPDAQFRLLVRSAELRDAIPDVENLDVVTLPPLSPLGRLRFELGQAAGLAREFAADVYFSVAESAPPRLPCPLIVCFRNPNVFTPIDQGWGLYQSFRLPALRRAAERTARRAARVVFVSQDSADWIGDSVDVPPEKRAVLHHGIDADHWRPKPGAHTPDRKGILAVSSVYRYKNFVRLIEAWRRLWDQRTGVPDLTIIGDVVDRDHARDMEAARDACGPLGQRIKILGKVPYAEMPAHYQSAALFVFPSYLETFGHPLLEAMAAGVPVVAADIPVFHEIAADAAAYCDPYEVASIGDAIGHVLDGPPLRSRLVAAGAQRVEAFSWEAAAEATAGLLARVIESA